jgi:hypothetical protein
MIIKFEFEGFFILSLGFISVEYHFQPGPKNQWKWYLKQNYPMGFL